MSNLSKNEWLRQRVGHIEEYFRLQKIAAMLRGVQAASEQAATEPPEELPQIAERVIGPVKPHRQTGGLSFTASILNEYHENKVKPEILSAIAEAEYEIIRPFIRMLCSTMRMLPPNSE